MMKIFIQITTLIVPVLLFFIFAFIVVKPAIAQCAVLADQGNCYNGYICICDPIENSAGGIDYYCRGDTQQICGANQGQRAVGRVFAPDAYSSFSWSNNQNLGLLRFLSLLIRLISIIAGIFAMVNFVLAGLTYITSMGNTQANINVRDRLLFSFIGLLIIVSAYTLAAIIGLIFFDDATFIINPKLQGALN